jgi:hypothetical protein
MQLSSWKPLGGIRSDRDKQRHGAPRHVAFQGYSVSSVGVPCTTPPQQLLARQRAARWWPSFGQRGGAAGGGGRQPVQHSPARPVLAPACGRLVTVLTPLRRGMDPLHQLSGLGFVPPQSKPRSSMSAATSCSRLSASSSMVGRDAGSAAQQDAARPAYGPGTGAGAGGLLQSEAASGGQLRVKTSQIRVPEGQPRGEVGPRQTR